MAEPLEHRLVRLGGGIDVVPRACVVEKGVVDTREHPDLVGQAGGFEGAAGGVLRSVDPRVQLGVDAEDGRIR